MVPDIEHRMLPSQWSALTVFNILFIFFVVYSFSVAVHRLYFSKYATFPGPKLAALTYGYMFYYDAIVGEGQYIYKIRDLHEEYGQSCLQIR